MNEMDTPSSLGEAPPADIGAIDVDALMSQMDSGGSPPPDPAPEGRAAGSSPTETQHPSAPPSGVHPELEFTANGKTIKVPLSDPRVKQWTQQGYSYAQQMAAFKQEQEAFTRQQQEHKARYGELETYVEQNPEWWNHVTQQWEQARAGMAQQTAAQNADPNNPLVRELEALKSQIGEVVKFKQDSETQKLLLQRQDEDRRVNEEIQSIRDSFKDLDWASVAADGKNMELQVLEFAQQRGLSSFKDAFLLFNHDRLLKRAEEKGKEAVVKERQKHTKLGLLGQTQAPRKGITHAEDIKNKSYDDLIREGAAEVGVEYG